MRKVVCNLCAKDWEMQHICMTRGAIPTVIVEDACSGFRLAGLKKDVAFYREQSEERQKQLDIVLPELQRLQELCKMQEQHDCEFVEERLKEFKEKIKKVLDEPTT